MSFLVKPQSEALLAVMPATVYIVILVNWNQNSLKLRNVSENLILLLLMWFRNTAANTVCHKKMFSECNMVKSNWFISGCGIIDCQCRLLNEHTEWYISSNLVNVQIKCMSTMYFSFNTTKIHIMSSGFAFKYIGFYALTFRKWVISHPPQWQRESRTGSKLPNPSESYTSELISSSCQRPGMWCWWNKKGGTQLWGQCSLWTVYSAHARIIFGYLVIHLQLLSLWDEY